MTLIEQIDHLTERQRRVLKSRLLQEQSQNGQEIEFTRLIAYVKPSDNNTQPDSKQLREHISSQLPEYMVPVSIQFVDQFPLNTNGKVDRNNLPDPVFKSETTSSTYPLKESNKARIITEIWSEILGIDNIGPEDNFFELGGHSLVAAQVMQKTNQVLGTNISILELFKSPTISGMVDLLEEEKTIGESGDPLIKQTDRSKPIPLSPAQERLWFIDQMQGSTEEYIMTLALRINGELDIPVLEQSHNAIISRHDGIRARFDKIDGLPVQSITKSESIDIRTIDLSHLDSDKQERRIHDLAVEEGHTPFDLKTGPLIRATVISKSDKEHVHFISCHHILADGKSWDIIGKELVAFYGDYKGGQSISKAPLRIHYPDYAAWQKERLRAPDIDTQLTFWTEQLMDLPTLELPLDFERPIEQSYDAQREALIIPDHLSQSFDRFTKKAHVSPFMGFLAVFQILLSKYSGQEDIVVGTVADNRNLDEVKDLVGLFTNTLALRSKLPGDLSFKNLIEHSRTSVLSAFENSDLPFERLVEEINPTRDLSRHPLFQVMIGVQNTSTIPPTIGEAMITKYPLPSTTTHVDLELDFTQTSSGWEASFTFNKSLFDTDTIRSMANHFVTILETVLNNPECTLSEISLLNEIEIAGYVDNQQETDFNYGPPATLQALVERNLEAHNNKTALSFKNSTISYDELRSRSDTLAKQLLDSHEKETAFVGLCIDRSIDMVVGMMAILKSGKAFVPIDPEFPKERITYILNDADAKILLTTAEIQQSLPPTDAKVILLDDEIAESKREINLPDVSESDLAYAIYTSGSTGKPKGVKISHKAVVNFLNSMAEKPGFTSEDTLLAVTTISFDISILELFLPLSQGGSVIIAEKETINDGQALIGLLERNNVTHMQATPMTWMMLIESAWQGDPDKLTIMCGGEPLPEQLADQLISRAKALWNMYGPTETTIWSSVAHIQSANEKISIGSPIANTQFYIVDANINLLPDGLIGELLIGGDGLAEGYHNRTSLTEEKFIPNPFEDGTNSRLYRTGDLARRLPSGNFECLGRIDNQIKIRGFRIELGEIEEALLKHPQVAKSVAAVKSYGEGDDRLISYFVAEGEETNGDDLKKYLSEYLPDYMIPFQVVPIDSVPLTPNGKVDRKSLPRPESIRSEYAAPTTELEKQLASIFSNLLNTVNLDIHDDFFQLGGNSLLTIRLCNEVNNALGTTLRVADVFRYPTISKLAKLLGKAERSRNYSIVLKSGGKGNPIFCMPGLWRHSLPLKRVADRLEVDRPVIGLELPIPVNGEEPLKTPDDFGKHLVEQIKTVQPEGPYSLCGYSLGGFFVYEVAKQLHELGDTIEHSIIFDTYLIRPAEDFQYPHSRKGWILKMLAENRLEYLRFFIRNTVVLHILRRFGLLRGSNHDWNRPDGTQIDGIPRLDCSELEYSNFPEPFDMNLHLFISRLNKFTRRGRELIRSWKTLTSTEIKTSMIQSDYHLRLLDDEHLDGIINELNHTFLKK